LSDVRSPVASTAIAIAGAVAVVLGPLGLVALDARPGSATSLTAAELADLADELRPSSYRLPVDAPVVRPFAAPSGPYAAGHRGIDLGAAPGTPVRAAERGRVAHAGQVAGVVWISIDHPDGVRTSYGPVAALQVAAGDEVARGDVLGRVAATDHGDPAVDVGLHLGARRDGMYIDPMSLPGIGLLRPTLFDGGGWWGAAHAVEPYAPWSGGRFGGLLTSGSPTAVAPGYAVPPNPNHLVLVAGLSSTSERELLDPQHLGIDPSSATMFSYAGVGLPYDAEATWLGVEVAAQRLSEQLRELALRQPGRAVDLVGHSLGGVVIAYYLLHHHDPWDISLPPIAHVVTVASPLAGSDLARLGVALVDAPGAGPTLRAAWDRAGDGSGVIGLTARSLHPDASSFRDVATASEVVHAISDAWTAALADVGAGPLASGTRVLNIVASRDLLVGADRAALDAAERRVLPGTHEGVLATEAVREVVWRFLAGRDVVQSPGYLSTYVGAAYGNGLSVLSATAGDLDALRELPLAPGAPGAPWGVLGW
jgi:hypothetical protein